MATRWSPLAISVICLEGAAHAETKYTLFLVKEEWETINDLIATRVGIISINDAKRHVQNRHLKAELGSQTAANIAKL